MYQSTTPTVTLNFPTTSSDLTTLGNALVTLKQGTNVLEIVPSVAAHSVTFTLTQEQSQSLHTGALLAQVNFTKANGDRRCSNIATLNVRENLHNKVITNGTV